MTYHTTTTTTFYDWFQHVSELKAEGKSWRAIGKIMNKDHSNLAKKYKRQLEKNYSKLNKSERVTDSNTNISLSKSSLSKNNNSVSVGHHRSVSPENNYHELKRLPKYGNLPPTGYKSNLSDDDWIINYCGILYSWKIPYLTEMRKFLRESVKGIVYLPRGHGKTKSVIGLEVRDILENYSSLLMLVSGPSAQRKLFREFKRIITSAKVRRDYGDILISFSTITGEAYYVDSLQKQIDPAVKVVGRGGDVIGSHPDKIHFEDIIQEEFKSDESNEGLKVWYAEVIEYCANINTRITVTGTRKGVDDFYSWLAKLHYEVKHKRSIDKITGRWPDYSDFLKETYDDGSGLIRERYVSLDISNGTFGTLNCPNWPTERLLKKRTDPETSSSFESQMQNHPLPSQGLYFNTNDFIVIDATKYNNNDYNDYYVFIDPAYGRSKKSDYTSILVACVMSPKLLIVDGIIDRLSFPEIEAWLKKYIEKYSPHSVYAEDNFLQIWLLQHTKAMAWPMIGITQTKNKIMRISATKAHWIEHRIEILRNYPGREKLYNEYVQYDETDSTTSKHDDGLDTVAMMCEELAHFVRSEGISWYS